MIQKLHKKNKISARDSWKSPQRKHNILTGPAFSTSRVMFPTLKLSSKPNLHRDDSLTFQLPSEKFQFEPQLTSLYTVSTPFNFQLNSNRRMINNYISYASNKLSPYEYWTSNNQKNFTVQMNFLRQSVFDLHTDDSKQNFQTVKKKRVHHETYKQFSDNIFLVLTKNFLV